MHTCHGIQAFTYQNKLHFKKNIQVEFYLIQNLNPIGIKIANQFVCCYLINPIKGGLKKSSYEQKEKRKKKFMAKRKIFFYNQKKKTTTTNIFFQKNKCLLYIDTIFYFFLGKEREGVYFKLKYLLPYLQFFFFFNFMQKHFW